MTIRDISYVGEGLIPAPRSGLALRYTPLPKGAVTDIAVHHWTGFLPPATWTADEEIAYILRIDEYHRTGRGLDGIGYHVCPFPSGRIYVTSRLDRYGAHVGYENNHLIGISLPGSFNVSLPSPQHLAATVEAVRYVYAYLGRDVPTTPHLNWGGTTCPGARWREWVPQLRAQALAIEEEDDDMLIAIQREGSGGVYATDGIHKWGVPNATMWRELQATKIVAPGLIQLTKPTFDRIRPVPSPLTKADVTAAVKAALPATGSLTEAQIEAAVLRAAKTLKWVLG